MNQTFSYWEKKTFLSGYDVIIIGCGIVGLSAALHLKRLDKKLNIALLEAGFLPAGASTKNAGFGCFGSISELIDELERSNEQEVSELVELRWKGLEKLRKNLGDQAICFNQSGGYEVFKDSEKLFAEKCINHIPYFNKLLRSIIGKTDIYAVANAKISEFGLGGINNLIENKYEGQIDSGKMMHALLSKVQGLGIRILNNCRIIKIEEGTNEHVLISNQANFRSRKIILATNAFISQFLPEIDVVPGRGQVLVTEPVPGLKLKGSFHYNKGYTYFRNIDERILLGGERNLDPEGERTTEPGTTDLIQNSLENLLAKHILPGRTVRIEHRWSGVMAFGNELKPIVKEVRPNMYCAVRCNGMGVAIGSLLGEQVAELSLL